MPKGHTRVSIDKDQQDEKLYHSIVENMNELICRFLPDGRLTFANQAYCKALNKERSEVIGSNIFFLLPYINHKNIQQHLSTLNPNNTTGMREDIILTPEGQVRCIQWTNQAVYREDGELINYQSVGRDITDYKLAEEKLQKNEALLKSILSTAPTGIGLSVNRVITQVNDKVCEMTGYSSEELIGTNARILYPDQEEFDRAGYVKDHHINIKGPRIIESRWKRKDGKIIDILLNASTLNPDDASAGMTFTVLDITERKKAEEALLENEEQFRLMFELAPIGMAITTLEGEYTRVNQAFCTLIGYSTEELLGHNFPEITYPEDIELNNRWRQKLLFGESPHFQIEKRYIHKDGHIIWAILDGALVRNTRGKPSHFLAQVIDITERKFAEEELKKSLSEKVLLLKEVHHRVKNNLQIISSLLELQSTTIEDNSVTALFQESQNRLRAMALIHEKIYQSDDLVKIDIREYIQSLVDYLEEVNGIWIEGQTQDKIIKRNILVDDLTLEIDKAIPLGIIISELVTNAYKHAFPHNWNSDSNINPEIRVEMQRQKDGIVTLKVSDNGAGQSGQLDFRKSSSLGIQLVTLLTNQIGGILELDFDKGTCYKISLPADI